MIATNENFETAAGVGAHPTPPVQCFTGPQAPAAVSPDDECTALSHGETEELRACEEIVDRGLETFVEVGMALCTIREHKLYRGEYRTFEHYLKKRWEFTARTAQRLMVAAEVISNLRTRIADCGLDIPLPTAESQVRPIADLPADKQFEVWRTASAEATAGRTTAKMVREARNNLADQQAPDGPIVDVKPGGSRNDRRREKALAAQSALLELAAEIGEADCPIAAHMITAHHRVGDYIEHLLRADERQKARAA